MKLENKAWLILISLSIVWGASFILMKKAMEPVLGLHVFSPYHIGGLRVMIAGVVLMPVALKNLKYLNAKNTLFLFFVGLCGSFIPAFLFPLAETEIQSSLAGLLNMGTSIFVVIIAWVFFKDKINKIQFLGLCLGIIGLFLILRKQINGDANNFYYALIVILATVFYAISLTFITNKLQHLKPKVITALAFFLMFIPAVGSNIYTGAFSEIHFSGEASHALVYLLILSILGTAIAVLWFNQLVAIATPLFAASVTYVIPIIALFFGVLDGETFDLINVLWIILILIGVFLMGKKTIKRIKNV